MTELIQQLRKVLATNFTLYLKTHMFHWNVEGQDFSEYHGFWGDIYDDLWNQTDTLAEFIRQAGEYAPGSLTVYSQISDVTDEEGFPSAMEMFRKFQMDNQTMINLYDQLYHVAELNHEHQISNYAADRLAAHKKHAWMVRSFLK
jgi:starvation-inducible DNA-binding protein